MTMREYVETFALLGFRCVGMIYDVPSVYEIIGHDPFTFYLFLTSILPIKKIKKTEV